jgi:hypothetical protein
MMAPMRLVPPADPPETLNIVQATQVFSFALSIATGSTAQTVSVAQIMANLPGSTTFWQGCRFEKFLVYGAQMGTAVDFFEPLQVNVGALPGGFLSLRDDGTTGQTRAKVGFRLGLLARSAWFGPADTTVLFSVNQQGATQLLRVVATISLRSPSSNVGV